MNLYFPVWLAYTVIIIALAVACILAIWIIAATWMAAVQKAVDAFKVARAFVRFLSFSEYRRGFGTIAEISEKLSEMKRERDQQRYLAQWALFRLHTLTDCKVGDGCCLVPGDDDQYLAEFITPYQEQWDAWAEQALAEEEAFGEEGK